MSINQLCSELRQIEGGAGSNGVVPSSSSEKSPSRRKEKTRKNSDRYKPPSNESSSGILLFVLIVKMVGPYPREITNPRSCSIAGLGPGLFCYDLPKSRTKARLFQLVSGKISESERDHSGQSSILLNKLMELTGEISLGETNCFRRQFAKMDDKSNLVAMAHMISDLQCNWFHADPNVKCLRFGGTFTKFKRIVRDLAKQLDKPCVDLVIKGERY